MANRPFLGPSRPLYSLPMDYDTAWKRLFGLPILVEHLLRGFIAPAAPWLDFGTLRELSASWTDTGRQQRHGDAAWRVDYADGVNGSGRSLVLLLEFQSSVDQSMASRVQRYKGMAYEELRRQGESDACGQLRLLPIVIHSGEQTWTAPGDITEISVADDGEILLPLPYSYLSLDVQRLPSCNRHYENGRTRCLYWRKERSSGKQSGCSRALSKALSKALNRA
ncbi:MAG: Rpn family recombination-promoting nuclease/putative transposase [Candidatus Tectomicrobia bacterium]|nr:Rpn family recombination-promoting nuclease/putative transposase [Candidatus Tectomicrobia bacterium]